MKNGLGRLVATAAGFGMAMVMAGAATATMDIQKKAKAAGFEATNCSYCHNEKLPKKGAATFNTRGTWLKGEKDKKKASAVDPAWLKDYVEPKK
jgi:hypothetical protein